ncbi:hypothetical protein HYALB_00003542 [Hymenoscyphus albidus]|uniref:Uncharacterized protein n=1 Tax=Hymenoscyphus albidus TaxID=595503 RepID=A0A9N9Q207_9HELO|nr:hypothetical protein HYALB_00003542 [Hymenoscyphus albidus]
MGGHKCLEQSTIHPQNHLPNRDNDNQATIKRSCAVADNPLSKASSPFTTQNQIPEDSIREAEDHEASLGAQQLLEIYKFDELPSNREILQITGLCDRQDLECKCDTISTSKHFHSPPEKCALPDSNSNPLVPPHEHCISQYRPLPDRAGGCLLLDRGRGHMCCYWRPDDRNSETSCSTLDERANKDDNVSAKREWEGRGMYRYGGAVKDQSCLVNVGVGPKNFYVWDHISELGSAGKEFLETLSESDLNAAAILIKLKELN